MSKMETISKVSLKLTSWINLGSLQPPSPSPPPKKKKRKEEKILNFLNLAFQMRMITDLPLRNITPPEIKNTLTSPKNPKFQNSNSPLTLTGCILCTPNHDTSTHVFKQLNQIVRLNKK